MLARRSAVEQVLPVGFQPGKEARIAEQAELCEFRIAGAEFALRQRVEQRGVGDDQDRLMEGADEILAVTRIDPGLAADRGVDLRQQAGRHLHEIQPAPHARRRISCKIADHSATERDDEIVALDLGFDQRVADTLERDKTFRPLAGRDHDARGRHAGGGKLLHDALQMRVRDILVGDDREPRARLERRNARAK
jgi:hypothetical protein